MPENYDDKTKTFVPLTSGTMVSHYRIIEKIGAGGMGEVYLAEDTKLNRKVALKFLPTHACQDADRRARFTREAQAAAKLNHPNIVTIYEVSEFNGRPFFAMENVEGQTFRDLGKSKELPFNCIIELAIQVSEGLAKAHLAGVVHRDIKPSNLLIDQDSRAKIVDFGLASVHGSEHLTKTGSTLGTVGYMSPEQARGEEADARSDLFSFGVVLYELIAGRAPFKAESDIATVKNIVEAVPEPLARYKNDVPDDLQRIIDKLLSKDRSLRYQHADDVATDLKRLISTVSSGPIPVRRKRRILITSIILPIAAIAVLIIKPWQLVTTPEQETTFPEATRVVIVPFKNETGDPSLDPIGTQVAARTSQGLTLLKHVVVVRPNAYSVRDTVAGIRSISEIAEVSRVVTGAYYKVGDSIQFQAQVSDSAGRLLAPVGPICVLTSRFMDGVEEVRQRVMGALAFGGVLYRAPLYDAYLQNEQGKRLIRENNNYRGSILFFMRARELDSGFNAPLLNMIDAYLNLELYAQTDSVSRILDERRSQLSAFHIMGLNRRKAELAGDRMEVLNILRSGIKEFPLATNWFTLGGACLTVNFPNGAIEAFKKVNAEGAREDYWANFAEAYHVSGDHENELEIAREGRRRFPSEVDVFNAEFQALAAMGKISELQKLIEDRPAFATPSTLAESMRLAAMELRAHGHEDEAMKLLDEAVRWYENQPPEKQKGLKAAYALTLYWARRWDKAKVIYEEFAQKSPRDSAGGREYGYMLGLIAARQGDRIKAMEVSEWLKSIKEPYQYGGLTYQRACIAAVLGDKAQAVASLKESFLQGAAFSIELHRDFNLESLWDYPPFIEFLKPKG